MASSSSPCPSRFDVFLSFRGEDTRKTIVSHLHSELQRKGLIVFKDDRKLQTGDSISTELVKAIQESRFAVVVISENYASSSWCLDELKMIMECQEKEILTVVPIFYGVNPSDVRHQKGTFAEAFKKHNVRETTEKVQKWREALRKVAGLSGIDSQKRPDDDAVVREIVGDISSRLLSMLPGDFGDLVGMDAHLKELDPLLKRGSANGVCMIGIWGMGGIGKTTIAKYLYSKLSREFLLHCFMGNIKKIYSEQGLVYLQERFLSEIFHENDIKLQSLEFGSSAIQSRVSHQKVLLVLDDVDKLGQLHALAREKNWFGPGSIIIVTTRDKGLLISHGIEHVHEVKRLGDVNALMLFNRFAFKGMPSTDEFLELSSRASRLVQGLPLALRVFGSSLFGRTIEEWKTLITNLSGDPRRDVMQSLKVSYDGLHMQDQVNFLCVACLFSEEPVSHVTQFLDGKESDISNSLQRLAEKSLIVISTGCVIVHDLIQEMAKEVVYERSPNDPGGRRFLLDAKDTYEAIAYGMANNAVEGISLNMFEMLSFPASNWGFQNMQNLKFLKIYNTLNCTEELLQSFAALNCLPHRLRLLDWSNCPLTTLPSTLHARCLVELRLPFSNLVKLWDGTVSLWNLKRMDLSCSFELKEIPDLSQAINIEELDLSNCYSLVKVPSSFSTLKELTRLSTRGCRNLEFLPSTAGLNSLKVLDSGACSSLKCVRELSKSIVELYLYEAKIIKVLDQSIQNLTALKALNLSRCDELLEISSMIGNLTALENLDLSGCKRLLWIPDTIGDLTSLRKLNLSSCERLESIPATIGKLTALCVLDLGFCKGLRNIPSTVDNLSALESLTISRCEKLSEVPHVSNFLSLRRLCLRNLNMTQVPDDIGYLKELRHLDLSGNDFQTLPASINQLLLLEELNLCSCKKLQSLPVLPPNIKSLYANDCSSLESIYSVSKYFFQKLMLFNCFKFNEDAETMIRREISKPIQMGEFKTWVFLCLREKQSYSFKCLRKKISLTVDLPRSSSAWRPVGFVAEIVVACFRQHNISDFRVCCRWHGEGDHTGYSYSCPHDLSSDVSDSSAESHMHLFFSCNLGVEKSSGNMLFDFELDCKMSYDGNCCQIGRCEVNFRFSEHNVQATPANLCPREEEPDIIAGISKKPQQMFPPNNSDIVGMDAHLKALDSLLNMGSFDNVPFIGIWGIGGVGKTTIAKCLYNKLKCQFEFHCLIRDVKRIYRKHGPEGLRRKYLFEMLGDTRTYDLRDSKVLIILDDVDELVRLEALRIDSECFGFGSRVIITTRNKGVLRLSRITFVYKVECMEDDVAQKLFNRFAFGVAFSKYQVPDGFEELSVRASELARGLPLSLRVLGTFLYGRKKDDWQTLIDRLSGDSRVIACLRMSYDGLDERDQAVFLTVACLFIEEQVSSVVRLLDGEEEEVKNSLRMLAEKALLEISNDGRVIMHDLIQEMAKKIVNEESPNYPGRRRFLWDAEEIYNVLQYGTGTDAIEGISLDMPMMLRCPKRTRAFENMTNLKFLRIHYTRYCLKVLSELPCHEVFNHLPRTLRLLDWEDCPLETLPCGFHPNCLVELRLPYAKLQTLSKGYLSRKMVRDIPNTIGKLLHLSRIPTTIGNLTTLRVLDLSGCSSLENIPNTIGKLTTLEALSLSNCLSLSGISTTIGNLAALKDLDLSGCLRLKNIPHTIEKLTTLEFLSLSACVRLLSIPKTIGNLAALKVLDLSDCWSLKNIPDTIGKLTTLEALSLSACRELSNIPTTIGNLAALEVLDLSGCRNIPSTIENLAALKNFSPSSCRLPTRRKLDLRLLGE